MSATAVWPRERLASLPMPAGARPNLATLARAIRDAAAVDVVVVQHGRGSGSSWLVFADELALEAERDLELALHELASEQAPEGDWCIRSVTRTASPAGELLWRHGLRSVLSTPLELTGRTVGALYVLRREVGRFRNPQLLAAYARQAAIALAHREQEQALDPAEATTGAIEQLDQMALQCRSWEELIRSLTATLEPVIGARVTGLMVWDKRRMVLQMVPGSFGADSETTASYQIRASDRRSNAARVFVTGHPYLSNTAVDDPGILQSYVTAFGIQQLMSIPLRLPDRAVGVLHLANKPAGFTVTDVERAEELGRRIATVVQTASGLFELRRQRRLESILAAVAVSIAAGENGPDFLVPTLQEICGAVSASMVALVPATAPPMLARLDPDDAHEHEQTVLAEAREMPGMRAYVIGPRTAGDPGWAAFHAPIVLDGQRIGTLAALRRRGEPFGQYERHALTRLANLASLAWASERYQQQRAELARLQERQRIADDLHDDVAQILFGAQLQLDAIFEQHPLEDEARAKIAQARALLIAGDAAIRTVIHQLSRPTQVAFDQRLATAVSEFEAALSLPVHLEISDDAASAAAELARPLADILIRAAREALTNIGKHAGPCRVQVTLRISRGARLVLSITDDGFGMARVRLVPRHGLGSLRRTIVEHGGMLRVKRGAAGGMRVTVSFPL